MGHGIVNCDQREIRTVLYDKSQGNIAHLWKLHKWLVIFIVISHTGYSAILSTSYTVKLLNNGHFGTS